MASTTKDTSGGKYCMGPQLNGVARCPHCNLAAPTLSRVWASAGMTERIDGKSANYWAAYQCRSCGQVAAAEGLMLSNSFQVSHIYPAAREAHQDIPDVARTFLQQAMDTLHSPDASAVMSGSAVDAMLKELNYKDGSLYARIDQALADNLLTKGMADWAHSVRLGSNRPRHSDSEKPHVTGDEARQSLDFAEALGNFLFVLTKRIERGIEAAR